MVQQPVLQTVQPAVQANEPTQPKEDAKYVLNYQQPYCLSSCMPLSSAQAELSWCKQMQMPVHMQLVECLCFVTG